MLQKSANMLKMTYLINLLSLWNTVIKSLYSGKAFPTLSQ